MQSEAYWQDLGLRALAAGFEWQRGAADTRGNVVISHPDVWTDGWCLHGSLKPGGEFGAWAWPGGWPDFRDPATVGVLIHQVEQMLGGAVWTQQADGFNGWLLVCGTLPEIAQTEHDGATRPEAIVAALEDANAK